MGKTRRFLADVFFRVIQLVLLPLGVVGYVIFMVKLTAFSRKSGISATVLASLYTRTMQHKLGTRRDDPAARLMKVMPNVPNAGLALSTIPTLAGHRLTGIVPKIYRFPYPGAPPMRHQSAARTTFYDEAVAKRIAWMRQYVILGAGFDTRAYRLPPESRVRCFEVDEPKTQAFKREMLKKAGVDTSRIEFVPADFRKEDSFEKLTAVGFDPAKPSLFTWESVMMFLDREAVESMFRRIAGTAAGSAPWPASPSRSYPKR